MYVYICVRLLVEKVRGRVRKRHGSGKRNRLKFERQSQLFLQEQLENTCYTTTEISNHQVKSLHYFPQ